LEAALLDADIMDVASLKPSGPSGRRLISARVAGPAALFVAKAYKIAQRQSEDGQRRLDAKDAGDVLRLMMATDERDVAARFRTLLKNERTCVVTARGLAHLRALFKGARTVGTRMAVEALAGDPVVDQVGGIAPAYLDALDNLLN
jgi:hypothetical protein